MATTKDLEIKQGKTFSLVLRWETEPIIRKPITGVSLSSGAPRPTVQGHGCKAGWRAAVTMVKGMTQLNAKNNPPRADDYHQVTVIDADTVEFNDITPVDDAGREWPAWTEGGFLLYNTPVDLTGFTARMKIKDKIGGTVLVSNDVLDAPKNVLAIAIDVAAQTITLSIPATATDDFAWTKGVYDLEMVSATGVVTGILSGKVSVIKEVTA